MPSLTPPDPEHPDPEGAHASRDHRYRAPGPVPVSGRRYRPSREQEAGDSRPADGDPVGGWQISDLVAAGVLDTVPGEPPALVSVWVADDLSAPAGATRAGLTARLAGMLLAIWTDPGEIIIDTTGDRAVQVAADGGARRYLRVDLPPSSRQARDLAGHAAVILLRWPLTAIPGHRPEPAPPVPNTPPNTPVSEPSEPGAAATGGVADLILGSCPHLLTREGHVAVIVAPPTSGHHDDARDVLPAAKAVGLGHLAHLVLISSDPHPTAPGTDWLAHPQAHVNLLVFILSPGRPEARDPSTGTDHPGPGPGAPPASRPRPPRRPPTSTWWLTPSRETRRRRYLPASTAHPQRMAPALAAYVIGAYTEAGDLVLDPMCGIGTTLIEALHAGRDAIGIECEQDWAQITRDNLTLAARQHAPGDGAVAHADARRLGDHIPDDLIGRVKLVLTSPPFASRAGEPCPDPASPHPADWQEERRVRAALEAADLDDLTIHLTPILTGCLRLLRTDGTVVITTGPYRRNNRDLLDLPSAVITAAETVGLIHTDRCIALTTPRPHDSRFQLPAPEDILIFTHPDATNPAPGAPGPPAESGPSHPAGQADPDDDSEGEDRNV